jgi:hypothetical protein
VFTTNTDLARSYVEDRHRSLRMGADRRHRRHLAQRRRRQRAI